MSPLCVVEDIVGRKERKAYLQFLACLRRCFRNNSDDMTVDRRFENSSNHNIWRPESVKYNSEGSERSVDNCWLVLEKTAATEISNNRDIKLIYDIYLQVVNQARQLETR